MAEELERVPGTEQAHFQPLEAEAEATVAAEWTIDTAGTKFPQEVSQKFFV